MEQHSLADGNVDWRALLEHVVRDSVVVEVKQGNATVACISPVAGKLPIAELNKVLASLPRLGDEAESFADDLDSIRRSVPAEPNPWD